MSLVQVSVSSASLLRVPGDVAPFPRGSRFSSTIRWRFFDTPVNTAHFSAREEIVAVFTL